jgi:hypothetical protein
MHTLTSLCIISHHPFFSTFRECLNILRRIIEACHARSLASKPGTPSSTSSSFNSIQTNKLIRDTVWGILTGSSGSISTEQISTLIACEIREIETWILRLLSAPVSVPGKTKLIVSFLIFKKINFFFKFLKFSNRLIFYQMNLRCCLLCLIIHVLISLTFHYIYHSSY